MKSIMKTTKYVVNNRKGDKEEVEVTSQDTLRESFTKYNLALDYLYNNEKGDTQVKLMGQPKEKGKLKYGFKTFKTITVFSCLSLEFLNKYKIESKIVQDVQVMKKVGVRTSQTTTTAFTVEHSSSVSSSAGLGPGLASATSSATSRVSNTTTHSRTSENSGEEQNNIFIKLSGPANYNVCQVVKYFFYIIKNGATIKESFQNFITRKRTNAKGKEKTDLITIIQVYLPDIHYTERNLNFLDDADINNLLLAHFPSYEIDINAK